MQRNDACTYSAQKDYLVTWKLGNALVREVYPTIAQASAFFDDAYKRWKWENRTDDNFLNLTIYTAMAWDAVWKGHAGDISQPCQSRTVLNDTPGKMMVTMPIPLCFGGFNGHGSSAFYSNGGTPWTGTIPQGGTELVTDHARWQGTETDNIWQSTTWGQEGLNSYQEAFRAQGYRLNGAKRSNVYDPNRKKGGWGMWDAGSVSKLYDIYTTDHEGPGGHYVRGTIAYGDNISTFRNNWAGIAMIGGGEFNFGQIEADENPSIFLMRPGHGRPGGGVFKAGFTKGESGEAPSRLIDKAQLLMDAEGWIDAEFGTVIWALVSKMKECMIRVNGITNTSHLSITNLQQFGPCRSILHDVFNRKAYLFDMGEYVNGVRQASINQGSCYQSHVKSIYWWGWNGGGLTVNQGNASAPVITAVDRPKPDRMAPLGWDPNTGNLDPRQWNDANATPAYGLLPEDMNGSAPPPVPVCTYTYSAWSAWGPCVNGQQTRTRTVVTSSPAGCVGTPVISETQACGVPPGVKYTASNLSNTDAGARTVINVPGVTKAVFTDIKWTKGGPGNYPYLLGIGTGTQALKAMPTDGSLWVETGVPTITASGKLVGGTAVTITVTFSTPVTITSIYNRAGSYDAFKGTIGKLELS